MNIYRIEQVVGQYDDITVQTIFCDYCKEDTMIAWEIIWDSIMLDHVMGTHDPYVIHNITYRLDDGNGYHIERMDSPWYFGGERHHYEVFSMKSNDLFGEVEGYNWDTYYKELKMMDQEFVTYNPSSRRSEGYNPHLADRMCEYLRDCYGIKHRMVHGTTKEVNNYLTTMCLI